MVSPSCFLKLAHEMVGNKTEIYIRESIVTSFYAAFHECNILAESLQNHGGMGDRTGSHAELINKLAKFPKNNPDGLCQKSCLIIKSIGYKLRACRDNRVISSYVLDADISVDERDNHLRMVQEIFDKVNELNEMITPDEQLLKDYKEKRQYINDQAKASVK